MSFSQRAGLAPIRPLQRASMDGRLRNGLWNALAALFMEMQATKAPQHHPFTVLAERVWVDFSARHATR